MGIGGWGDVGINVIGLVPADGGASGIVRSYLAGDLPSVYRICRQTGDSGRDATALYRDPELLGHYYAAPYARFEPDLCFVLEQQGAVTGYILGTRDSAAFARRCARAWFPPLRARYPLPAADDHSPDAALIRLFYAAPADDPVWAEYPAHLHIDLLPVAQGQGWGRALMDTFLAHLRATGTAGVHLGVATSNQRAVAFYARLGFCLLRADEDSQILDLRLAEP